MAHRLAIMVGNNEHAGNEGFMFSMSHLFFSSGIAPKNSFHTLMIYDTCPDHDAQLCCVQ